MPARHFHFDPLHDDRRFIRETHFFFFFLPYFF